MGDSYRPSQRGNYHNSDRRYIGNRRNERGYEDYDAPDRHPRYNDAHQYNHRRGYEQSQRYSNYRDSGEGDFYDAPRAPSPPPADGSKDESPDNESSRLVLIRGLRSSIPEAVFAKGLDKLCRGDSERDGATPNSLKRVLLIRDRKNDHSMGYGFAEYHEREDAQAAVDKAKAMGDSCTIGSQSVLLSFPHKGVFPHASYNGLERNDKFTIEMQNSSERHKYCDDRYYASELIVNESSPHASLNPEEISKDTPKKSSKGVKRGTDILESAAKKMKASDAAPAIFQRWQKQSAELRSEAKPATRPKLKHPARGVNTISAAIPEQQTFSDEQTFCLDDITQACYLCNTALKTSELLHRHIMESEKHTLNLANDKAIQQGYERLKANGIDPASTIKISISQTTDTTLDVQASMPDQPVWRDRAAERRDKEAETGVALEKVGFSLKNKGRTSKIDNSDTVHSSSDESSKPKYGKGMSMLQKHGWAEGQGLGSGDGITAPIDQSLYASGVGLGHQSSKVGDAVEEAERLTKGGGSDFLDKTKETFRKRFEEMK